MKAQSGNAEQGTNIRSDPKRRVTAELHPYVYGLILACVVWFALAVWSFAGGGMTDYLLVIVSGFIFIAAALPLILSRVQRADDAPHDQESLRDWSKESFDTWSGRLRATDAATQILLPIAAAALGMTAFGILFLVIEHAAQHGGA
jgi:hypothetical protein